MARAWIENDRSTIEVRFSRRPTNDLMIAVIKAMDELGLDVVMAPEQPRVTYTYNDTWSNWKQG